MDGWMEQNLKWAKSVLRNYPQSWAEKAVLNEAELSTKAAWAP
jgi:hypothetical protein